MSALTDGEAGGDRPDGEFSNPPSRGDGSDLPAVGELSDGAEDAQTGGTRAGLPGGSMLSARMHFGSYPSPLPSPEDFAAYESTQEGTADWLMRLVEREATHRQGLERMEAERVRDASATQNAVARRGQPYAFVFAVLAAGAGLAAALNGAPLGGAAAAVAAIGLVAAAFLTNGRVSWRGLAGLVRRDRGD